MARPTTSTTLVALRYQCLPGADNAKIASCTASQKGPNLDTSARGRFTFSVTATNAEGLTFTQTANYAVDPCDTSMTLDKAGVKQLTTTQYPNCIKDPNSYYGFGYGVKEVDGPYEINGVPFSQASYRTTLISPDGSDPNLTRSCDDDGSFPILFQEPGGGGFSCGDAYQQAVMRLCLSPIHNDFSGVPQCTGNELDVPVYHGLLFGVNWTQVGIDGFDTHRSRAPPTRRQRHQVSNPHRPARTGCTTCRSRWAATRTAPGTRCSAERSPCRRSSRPLRIRHSRTAAAAETARGSTRRSISSSRTARLYGNIPWNTTGAQGMRITVPQAYVGAMPVKNLCFAETNFGAQACPQPSGGNGFLVAGRYNGPCQADDPGHGSSPWNGGLSLQLPGVPGNRWISMWGNLDRLDGGITGLAFSNNINLGSIGAVLCVGRSPDAMAAGRAPDYLAGSIGGGNIGPLNLPSNVASFDYDDTVSDSNPADYVPWRMSVTGPNFSFKGLSLSSPTVGINGSSQLDLSSGVSESWAGGIFSVDGNVAGWVAPSQDKFSFTGSARACIKDIGCHHVGDFAVSSKGAAACADLSTNYGLFTISWHAGAGVYWDPFSVDVMPSSCGISDYQETRTYTVREIHSAASVSGLPIHVAPRQKLLVVRATGDGAPPKIALSSPDGVTRIVSPANSDGINDPGHDYLVENPSDNSTNVIVPMPAAGTWTLTPEDPAHPITDAQVAWYQPLPTVTGTVQGTGTRRAVVLRYTKPASDQILLDERGNRYGAIIANNVTGARCPGHPTHEGVPVMCARVPFRPGFGASGRRTIQAVITKADGSPIKDINVATFHVAPFPKPAAPRDLRVRRLPGRRVAVSWTPSPGAAHQVVMVRVGDGRSYGVTVSGSASQLVLRRLDTDRAVTVSVAGMRSDEIMGASAVGRLGVVVHRLPHTSRYAPQFAQFASGQWMVNRAERAWLRRLRGTVGPVRSIRCEGNSPAVRRDQPPLAATCSPTCARRPRATICTRSASTCR